MGGGRKGKREVRGMDTESTLAKELYSIEEQQARYDAVCKRLLSEKIILAWIMKSCLEEYRDCSVNEIAEQYIEGTPQVGEEPVAQDEVPRIHSMGGEDATLREGTVAYDIRFTAAAPVSGELIRLIVNVEAQNDFYPGYPLIKRALYYCSRLISAQYGTEFTEGHYEKIKKVYSIWICMNPPKNRKNTITRYRIAEESLIGSAKEQKSHYDLLSAVMLCLGEAGDDTESGALDLLNVLLSDKTGPEQKCRALEEDFQISMTQHLDREVSLMCNLSKGVADHAWQKGLEEGRAAGREEGRAAGLEEGREEGFAEAILGVVRMCRKLNMSDEEIARQLAEEFSLAPEEALAYLAKSGGKNQ